MTVLTATALAAAVLALTATALKVFADKKTQKAEVKIPVSRKH